MTWRLSSGPDAIAVFAPEVLQIKEQQIAEVAEKLSSTEIEVLGCRTAPTLRAGGKRQRSLA